MMKWKIHSESIISKCKAIFKKFVVHTIVLIFGIFIGFFVDKITSYWQKIYLRPDVSFITSTELHKVQLFDKDKEYLSELCFVETIKHARIAELIDENPGNEIIIATDTGSVRPGHILIFDQFGRELASFNTFDTIIMNNVQTYNDFFTVKYLEIEDIWGSNSKQIIAIAGDPQWWPSRLIVIDPTDMKTIFDYWHHGHISILDVVDMDNNGTQEIICGGFNNKFGRVFNHEKKNQDSSKNVYICNDIDSTIIKTFSSKQNISVIFSITPEPGVKGASINTFLSNELTYDACNWYIVMPRQGIGPEYRSVNDFDGDGLKDIRINLKGNLFVSINYTGKMIGISKGDTDSGKTTDTEILPIYSLAHFDSCWNIISLDKNSIK